MNDGSFGTIRCFSNRNAKIVGYSLLQKFCSSKVSVNMNIPVKIGIIGGSGLDDPDILDGRREVESITPFGKPSDALIEGKIKNVDCVILARHGRKHSIMPSNVNYRANIWALKQVGCTHILATNACGSLKETIKPGDLIFPDQFIDRTTKRCSTFYDGEQASPPGVCHIPMHTPFCPETSHILKAVTKDLGYEYHPSGTIIVIEGPRYSTKAESHLYRSWNADIIGMTSVPEVVLAKEAKLCYASIGMATDYDCWHETEDSVTAHSVVEVMKNNSFKAKQVLLNAIPAIAAKDWTKIAEEKESELKSAVM